MAGNNYVYTEIIHTSTILTFRACCTLDSPIKYTVAYMSTLQKSISVFTKDISTPTVTSIAYIHNGAQIFCIHGFNNKHFTFVIATPNT